MEHIVNILLGLFIGNFAAQVIIFVIRLIDCLKDEETDEKTRRKKTNRGHHN